MKKSQNKPNKIAITPEEWMQVALGIGGNIGDVKAHMLGALELLIESDTVHLLVSSDVFETPPWGIKEQANYLNSCVIVSTSLTPPETSQIMPQGRACF